jgi:hypothetical protein
MSTIQNNQINLYFLDILNQFADNKVRKSSAIKQMLSVIDLLKDHQNFKSFEILKSKKSFYEFVHYPELIQSVYREISIYHTFFDSFFCRGLPVIKFDFKHSDQICILFYSQFRQSKTYFLAIFNKSLDATGFLSMKIKDIESSLTTRYLPQFEKFLLDSEYPLNVSKENHNNETAMIDSSILNLLKLDSAY